MKTVRQDQLFWATIIFALPIIGALVPQAVVYVLVPRDYAAQMLRDTFAVILSPGSKPEVVGAMYLVAIASTITLVTCAISLVFCVSWLAKEGSKIFDNSLRRSVWATAVTIPLVFSMLAYGLNGLVDDAVTRALFDRAGLLTINWPYAFDWDAKALGFLVYTSFAEASLVIAVATLVSTHPSREPRARDSEQNSKKATVIDTILFLTTAVLVAAMITARFRFDVGVAAIGPLSKANTHNISFVEYQSVSSSILTYWATVLSLSLACIYLPGTLRLTFVQGSVTASKFEKILTLNKDNLMRLVRLGAVLSPPIINKLIQTFTATN
jgi:hypothetical protein